MSTLDDFRPEVDAFVERSEQFIETLAALTRPGDAVWVRRSVDPGSVFCFVRDERVDFTLHCGDPPKIANPANEDDLQGVAATYRNMPLLWLPSARC